MKKKYTFQFKILLIIGVSLLITSFLNNEVFVANTPRVRQDAGKDWLAKILQIGEKSANFITRIFIKNEKKRSPFYKEVAQGVYAKEDGIISEKLYTANDIQWKEYKFEHNGKTYTIRYAASDEAPDREILEKLIRD